MNGRTKRDIESVLLAHAKNALNAGETFNTTNSTKNAKYRFDARDKPYVDAELQEFLVAMEKLLRQRERSRGRQKTVLGLVLTAAGTWMMAPRFAGIAKALGTETASAWSSMLQKVFGTPLVSLPPQSKPRNYRPQNWLRQSTWSNAPAPKK